MITSFRQYDYYDGDWEMVYRGDIFYSEFTSSGIPLVPVSRFRIFPNPADDVVNIILDINNGETLFEIYNISGKMVKSQKLPISGQVSVRNLNSGIYFLKLLGRTDYNTLKLIIN